jgi:NTP pyrophosphatase (non-canonical NTP hydrolase)
MKQIDLDAYYKEVREVCAKMNWTKDWQRGGNYIFLEAAEFVEALRGKGDPVDELGDLLFTIFAVADHYDVDPIEAIEVNRKKLKRRMDEKLNEEK